MKIQSFKDLEVWKKGIEIADLVYDLTGNFPSDEKFGITSQMRRCAVSIPSNISEGFMRNHLKEYLQFLYISLGSCGELETQAIIALKRTYLTQDQFEILEEILNHQSRMLRNLIGLLKTRSPKTEHR